MKNRTAIIAMLVLFLISLSCFLFCIGYSYEQERIVVGTVVEFDPSPSVNGPIASTGIVRRIVYLNGRVHYDINPIFYGQPSSESWRLTPCDILHVIRQPQ